MQPAVQLSDAPVSNFVHQVWEGQLASVINGAFLEIPSDFIRRRLYVRNDVNITSIIGAPAGTLLYFDIVFELAGQRVFQLPHRRSLAGGVASSVNLFYGRGANLADSGSRANSVWLGDNSGVIPTAMTGLNTHCFDVNIAADKIRINVTEEFGGVLWDLWLGCHSESLIL